MKKEENGPQKFESLSDAFRAFGLPAPKHPLISLINGADEQFTLKGHPSHHVLGFYKISYKPKLSGRVRYGQSYYDFDEGGLLFAAPGQVIGDTISETPVCSEYSLLVHPDFFLGYPLAKAVISKISLLLNYANRFYKRQFITRKAVNNDLLQKMEAILDTYFNDEQTLSKGLPTVHYLADHLNMTPSYLSDMLRSLTGQNAQQHIHSKLIEKAKEKLSTTSLSVNEVAYALGFEHSQSFSKLFKTKTNLSPLEFRRSFN
jgi:AraC family transcriptional activator of pobA